jgi:hypothetical protein
MDTLCEYDHTCKFSISSYLIKTDSGRIVESNILVAMKRLYSDGILISEPVDVRLITEAEYDGRQEEDPDSPIDAVVIYFLDKE